MDLIKKLFDLIVYYRQDEAAGKPYWRDPAVIGLVISLLATVLLKWAGIDIDSGLQLKIVGVITGIGALVSPHTGIAKAPAGPAFCGGKQAVTRNDGEHNLTSLS
jgi:uncharacterized membrane protein